MNISQRNKLSFGNQILVDESEINQCEDGYKGLLCSACDIENNYYKVGLIVCRKCPDYYILKFILRTLFNIIWFVLFSL